MIELPHLARKAEELGAVAAAVVDTSKIQFVDDFRAACEMNTCGNFGKSWTCPPAVGPVEELKAEVARYPRGIVMQTVCQLADSFDFEGMQEAALVHDRVFRSLFEHIESAYGRDAFLALSVGHCRFCKTCTYPLGTPCRFPARAVSSLEAYCMDVNALLTEVDIPYYRGPNTVSYVALFLFSM